MGEDQERQPMAAESAAAMEALRAAQARIESLEAAVLSQRSRNDLVIEQVSVQRQQLDQAERLLGEAGNASQAQTDQITNACSDRPKR